MLFYTGKRAGSAEKEGMYMLFNIPYNIPRDQLSRKKPPITKKKVLKNKLKTYEYCLAQKKELTDFSTIEQKSAGLNDCNDSEIQLFEELNHKYFVKFNFPFIMAVKEKNKSEILSSFKSRQKNTVSQERPNALSEINKIAWLRIKEIYGL